MPLFRQGTPFRALLPCDVPFIPAPQDSGRLLDFEYSDEDIDSLRKQMDLYKPPSPASSLSDELGALGEFVSERTCILYLSAIPSALISGQAATVSSILIPKRRH